MDKARVGERFRGVVLIVFGTGLIAFGTAVFLVPFDLVAGGVSGIAIAVSNILGGALRVDLTVAIITWGLFFFGLLTLGADFALKTLLSTVLYPIFFFIFSRLPSPDFLQGYFDLASSEYYQLALMLSSLLGGAAMGCGCAFAFMGGGSTGGTDIIVLWLSGLFPRVKSSVIMLLIDGAIVLLGVVAIGDFVVSVLGIISAITCAVTVDRVFLGGGQAFVAHVVSDRAAMIGEMIIGDMERSYTLIDCVGGYSGKTRQTLIVSFTVRQYGAFLARVTAIDPDAFITVYRAHEINGEGWSR